jgi:hypothetical protein
MRASPRRWKLQILGYAELPNDELVDLQTPYSSAPDREATNGDSADGQCTNCQRAECLGTDRESLLGSGFLGAEDAQRVPSHRITNGKES